MDRVDEKLTTASRNEKLHNAIRVSSKLAKSTLNKYYSLTDMSATYRIAMSEFLTLRSSSSHLGLSPRCY